MASMRQYAADFIKFWREKCDNRLLEDKLEVIRERHKPKTFNDKFDYSLQCDDIHEVRIHQDKSFQFLVGYKNPHIPP